MQPGLAPLECLRRLQHSFLDICSDVLQTRLLAATVGLRPCFERIQLINAMLSRSVQSPRTLFIQLIHRSFTQRRLHSTSSTIPLSTAHIHRRGFYLNPRDSPAAHDPYSCPAVSSHLLLVSANLRSDLIPSQFHLEAHQSFTTPSQTPSQHSSPT